MNDIIFSHALFQSKYLYLQAAGSTGTDGSVSGIHLRWDLTDKLGECHIPKGNLATSGAGFNKANDTVAIYRSAYTNRFPLTIDFSLQTPSAIIDSSNSIYLEGIGDAERIWIYNVEANGILDVVYVRFVDVALYDEITILASSSTKEFLRAYGDGLLEVWVKGKKTFSNRIYIDSVLANARLRFETIANVDDVENDIEHIVTSRKTVREFIVESSSSGFSQLSQEEGCDILQEDSSLIYLEQEDAMVESRMIPEVVSIERILLQETESELHHETQDQIQLERDEKFSVTESDVMGYCAIKGENIDSIRFTVEGGVLSKIEFETYERYVCGVNTANSWELLGSFGLTTDATVAFARLEPTSGTIDGCWPNYKDGATVDLQIYRDMWNGNAGKMYEDGLAATIRQYVVLSDDVDNPLGKTTMGEGDDEEQVSLPLLDMLKLASYDYHVARMLGLGYIDDSISDPNVEYVYMALYETQQELPEGSELTHIFVTAPISKRQEKLPESPVQKSVSYGLSSADGETEITKKDGYTYDNLYRYVNLYVQEKYPYKEAGVFFELNDEFVLGGITDSVFYGIEYKNILDAVWHNLSEDAESGIISLVPSGMNEDGNIYSHREQNAGVHQYRVYGVNWFSRASEYGNTQSTDETRFTKRNTLLPPVNLHVQLIQKENPLLLTTAMEQQMLQEIGEGDKTLVRVQCNYTKTQDKHYHYADSMEFLFRRDAPYTVKGQVLQVEYDEGHLETFIISVGAHNFLDIDGNLVSDVPSVNERNFGRFIGGTCMIQDSIFMVEAVRDGVNGLQIQLQNNYSTSAIDVGEDVSELTVQKSWQLVSNLVECSFVMIENMANADNWKMDDLGVANVLGVSVQIASSDWEERTETIVTESETYEETTRGIWDTARITPYPENVSETNLYLVEMDTKVLHNHPQSNEVNPVSWDKGYVYIHTSEDANGERKQLDVVSIVSQENECLKLIIQDDERNIQTGNGVSVQFYPGYRVYLYADDNVDFNETNLLPQEGEGDRTTYMSVRAKDSEMEYESALSKPTLLHSIEILEALAPEIPIGGLYATRPDFYNKSTYTFSVACKHKPYSLAFYRASERMILEALYKPETVQQIKADLQALGEDEFFTSRWQNLIDFDYVYDDVNGKYYDATGTNQNGAFRCFPAENGYRFPKPDKEKDVFGRDLFDGQKEPSEVLEKVKEAIVSCFLPLTEQPLLYEYISKSRNYIPNNTKQKVRDIHGDLLSPNDADFCQAPMAKVVTQGSNPVIQFTDFSLDGASRNFYFIMQGS